jgi:hypothetical protein
MELAGVAVAAAVARGDGREVNSSKDKAEDSAPLRAIVIVKA